MITTKSSISGTVADIAFVPTYSPLILGQRLDVPEERCSDCYSVDFHFTSPVAILEASSTQAPQTPHRIGGLSSL